MLQGTDTLTEQTKTRLFHFWISTIRCIYQQQLPIDTYAQ